MLGVYQDRFGKQEGNCQQAAVASIFELPLDAVPHFCEGHRDDWQDGFDDWLAKRGLQLLTLDAKACREFGFVPRGYHIIAGKSPRGDFQHAVVGKDGVMVHDPHPAGDGLETEETWDVFVAAIGDNGLVDSMSLGS